MNFLKKILFSFQIQIINNKNNKIKLLLILLFLKSSVISKLYLGLAVLLVVNIKSLLISSCLANLSNSSLGVFFFLLRGFVGFVVLLSLSSLSFCSRIRWSCLISFLVIYFWLFSKFAVLSKNSGVLLNELLINELLTKDSAFWFFDFSTWYFNLLSSGSALFNTESFIE